MRRLLGAKSVTAEAQRVRELLDGLALRGGGELAGILFEEPRGEERATHRDLQILVNGHSVAFLDGLDTRLAAGDVVTLHLSGARGYPGG